MKTILSSGAFQKIYNPSVGETNSWYINDHCFIRDKTGLWHMFGITQQEPAKPQEEKFFAHATSRNILNPQWEKHEPVLQAEMEKWGETLVWAPHIVENNGLYFIFYCAGGQNDDRYKIHLAISSDLWSWERHEANPMVVDGYHARDPMIIQHQGGWIMYYTANRTPSGGQHVVAAVTSKDLIHWEDKREVFVHPQSGTYGGPTESPFVVQKNGKFYLFVCTNTPYNDSAVYESSSPFEWKIENQVGRFSSHASEVIHLKDEDQYYISRAGWGQGGLYLAELFWNESSAR